jgi:NAD+ synthase (glutamine-hydrolysing)
MTQSLKLVLAQLNLTVGDVDGNLERMLSAAREAHDADLVLYPELSLTGYGVEDMLFHPALRAAVEAAESSLLAASADGPALVYGRPAWEAGRVWNLAVVAHRGRVLARYRKRCLPNYGVFDEKRWFTPGDSDGVFEFGGFRLGLTVCEDLWQPGPMAATVKAGAEAVLSISASPYARGKTEQRVRAFGRRTAEAPAPLICCNLLGGQDELVFDGGSCALDADGSLAMRAPAWEEGLYPLLLERRADGSAGLRRGEVHEPTGQEESLYRGAVLGTADYIRKTGAGGVLLGLSGGIDSALALAVAVDALGPERVTTVMMASPHTREISVREARRQAEMLGVEHLDIPIGTGTAAVEASLVQALGDPLSGVTAENLQSRMRGLLLMALSNQSGRLLLATGNKSELAVGYATLYGDMCGAYAPLRDLTKTWVYRLARYRNSLSPAIPEAVIERAPSAELRPDQYDSDSLPDYAMLDDIIEAFVEQDMDVAEIVARGHDEAEVRRVLDMICANEYKRRQGPPGPRLSPQAFGRDRRWPIVNRFRPGQAGGGRPRRGS